ncbi:MAG: outer membrane protein transport protein, partial [Muribaculaceae bacterium]|nr:outer membrane protein transport protein [Muribaculaceae bacterium]
YYKTTTTVRLGVEYRITPRFSVRAGYANVSSPVRKEAKDGTMMIYTSGTMPNYRMDNSTNYITCGLGYNFNNFYIDGAFVHKHMSSEYHAYTSDPANPQIPSPTSRLSLSNNQIVLSAGVRF